MTLLRIESQPIAFVQWCEANLRQDTHYFAISSSFVVCGAPDIFIARTSQWNHIEMKFKHYHTMSLFII